MKNLVDLIYFDGTGNVQKVGRIIEAKYPSITSLHGAEHCISLFFSDISKIPLIQVSTNHYILTCCVMYIKINLT